MSHEDGQVWTSTQNVIRFLWDAHTYTTHIPQLDIPPPCYFLAPAIPIPSISCAVVVLGQQQHTSTSQWGSTAAHGTAVKEVQKPPFFRLTVMWECVHMERPFTVWACLRVAEQNQYKCATSQRSSEEKRELLYVRVDMCGAVSVREWEVGTAVFLQREALIFRPSVGMWEMSASNWVDKTVLSLRRKYGFPHKRPPH